MKNFSSVQSSILVNRYWETKMEEENKQPETKEMLVRINLRLEDLENFVSTYIVITGIPKDLPSEYEQTVIKTAERQFAQALNTQKYLEVYGHRVLPTDDEPTFINLELVKSIHIIGVEKVY